MHRQKHKTREKTLWTQNESKNRERKIASRWHAKFFIVARCATRKAWVWTLSALSSAIYKLIFTIITPSSSDSVNFWFCAQPSSRMELAATETSFPVERAPNSLADTFVGTERVEIDVNVVGVGWDYSAHQWSPPELRHRPLKRPANVYKE